MYLCTSLLMGDGLISLMKLVQLWSESGHCVPNIIILLFLLPTLPPVVVKYIELKPFV